MITETTHPLYTITITSSAVATNSDMVITYPSGYWPEYDPPPRFEVGHVRHHPLPTMPWFEDVHARGPSLAIRPHPRILRVQHRTG